MYVSMAWVILLRQMYSSALWLRALSPGPNFSDGKGIRVWSLRVVKSKSKAPLCDQLIKGVNPSNYPCPESFAVILAMDVDDMVE